MATPFVDVISRNLLLRRVQTRWHCACSGAGKRMVGGPLPRSSFIAVIASVSVLASVGVLACSAGAVLDGASSAESLDQGRRMAIHRPHGAVGPDGLPGPSSPNPTGPIVYGGGPIM